VSEVDPRTGLAPLPDGYFFRIEKYREAGSYGFDLKIFIRRKRIFGSTSTGISEVSRSGLWGMSWQQSSDVVATTWSLASRLHNKLNPPPPPVDYRTEILGDYPPKKFGNPKK
jgi:hypothetical protein